MNLQIQQAFSHIQFIEEGHRYLNLKTNQYLTSVTKRISDYKKPFQKDFWLRKKAVERGITPRELETEWNLRRDIGVTRGTLVHNYLEARMHRKVPTVVIPSFIDGQKMNKLLELAESFYEQFDRDVLFTELVMGDDMIGGTADLIVRSSDTEVDFYDYKTDKKLDFDSKYGNLLGPFSHFPDCEISKYTIQLNSYAKLVEEQAGILVRNMYIVWLNIDNEKPVIYQIKRINVNALWQQSDNISVPSVAT